MQLHNCSATWRETVPVHEVFHGKTVWQGEVEVFDLQDHPKAKRAYAWSHRDGQNDEGERFVAVLEIPPVVSALTAVQVSIVPLSDVSQDARRGHHLDRNDSRDAGQAKNCAVDKAHEKRRTKVSRNPQTTAGRKTAQKAYGRNQGRTDTQGKHIATFRSLDAFRKRITPSGQTGFIEAPAGENKGTKY